ncbi:glycoside hydrolase family 20 protein [Flectobacillus sp. DC10W]|uniref:beta-N-acetylhexosaminidase n=1 Tax=Flectobacillus longus TaxID=2984207 RepID=A0ABT6YN17_9BACT|nr:glycoside hydrolase family 20 protein [Flectobacillus longus]MDI9865008.1 glycoside hydrolase family 20 protein [Flectobacillus longus]
MCSKTLFSLFFAFLFLGKTSAQNTISIIPKPVEMQVSKGYFRLEKNVTISLQNSALQETAQLLRLGIQQIRPSAIGIKNSVLNTKNSISLKIDSNQVSQKEGYSLAISATGIKLIGHDAAGVFYGTQTLLQLIHQQGNLPFVQIKDYPRFGYRGMHLDVGRRIFSVKFLKKYLDLLALYKFNTFHWHLTEDQGWRIEIKRYPKLQSVAAYRNETIIGHKKDSPHRFDGKPYGGFYTQEEVKEIVAFAQKRNITVIPEIEMPGHARAALAAYPQLGCTGGPYQTATFWGVFDDVFCAGNDSTFTFLQNVLDEVLPLFPSKYVHIGGDECPKVRWKSCPKCQKRIQENHLKDEHELQSYFIQKMEKYLNSKGKNLIGWDEILEGGLSPKATVMSWQGEAGGIAAAQQHHDVVMCPESHYYLDYYQSLQASEPIATAGFTPLEKVYRYEPIPAILNPTEQTYIKGIQGNAWSEYLVSEAQAEYMLFPRALAIAETAWSPKTQKDYDDFLQRLRLQEKVLKHRKVHYFDRYEEIQARFQTNTNGSESIYLTSSLPNATIRFTEDGSQPNTQSNVWKDGLSIFKPTLIKAQLFDKNGTYGQVWEQWVNVNLATGKSISFKNTPQTPYLPTDAYALSNGIIGTHRYNTGQWIGFRGEDLEVVVDLGKSQSVQEIGISVLKYHWQRMWEPTELSFWISEDGKAYEKVGSLTDFPENAINTVSLKVPNKTARFVKVIGVNKGTIPAGEYGAGAKAWLIVDELFIY